MSEPAHVRTLSDPLATLRDPAVRKYFLALLDSTVSAEEKYQAFVRFFELESDLTNRFQAQTTDEAVVEAARKVWEPKRLVETTRACVERALLRIERSRHQDGGWGYEVQQSHPWATAWTVLCLQSAAGLATDGSLLRLDRSEDLIAGGLRWLIDRRRRWSLYPGDDIQDDQGRSVYEAAVALRCLYETGAADRAEVKGSVEGSIARLLRAQRRDGEWDARLWADERAQPSALEVGATSYALQALAATGREDAAVREAAILGIQWLKQVQNPDGSWNGRAYVDHAPVPVASVNKTCDGLKGFLAGRRLGIDLEPYQPGIDNAVRWLLEQEQAVIGDDGKIKGWGWKDSADGRGQTLEGKTEGDLLENTCLTLETLLEIESVALPLLASNALWLTSRQAHDGDDDGKWSNNDTGRIAFALLDFYCRIRKSPVFQPAGPVGETTVQDGAA